MTNSNPSNVPSVEAAVGAFEATRQRTEAETVQQDMEERMLAYGEMITTAQEVMATVDLDDIPRLKAATAALRGEEYVVVPSQNTSGRLLGWFQG